jgi:hypothetical protein
MEKTRNYRVWVEQVDRFSHEFIVSAPSEDEAKRIVEKMMEEVSLDGMKDTYDRTDLSVEVLSNPLEVHTVEALFDIDKDISDEEVILVEDLSLKQKVYLGLVSDDEIARESLQTFLVFSSGGSLKVDGQTGLVIECTTERNEDNELKQIVKFNLDEYKEHYRVVEIPGDLDILDLGYWNKDGGYEKPVEDWRNEMRRAR